MAKIWNEDITINTDWGGDESTGFAPVSGGSIQRFLKGQLLNLGEAITRNQERDAENELITSTALNDLGGRITLLDELIQELSGTIQDLKNKEVVKVITKSEWEELKASGQVDPNILYGILEEGGEDEPGGDEEDSGIKIEYDEINNELIITGDVTIEDDTLEIIGEYDEENNELIVIN